MKADRYRFDGSKKCDLSRLPTDSREDGVSREEITEAFEKNLKKLDALQNVFYADRREGIVVVLQALDAAGKDSLIRKVATGLNPQGVHVACFKKPSEEELSHDYLWRINRALPARGEIAIFNRSYYEDVVTAKVHHLKDSYHMAERITRQSEDEFSKQEQKKRFLERIDRKEKNWKFNADDLTDRKLFDTFMKAFEDTIDQTATKESPWYAIPADDKWYTRYLLSEILIDVIEKTKPEYPELPGDQRERLQTCREELVAENGGRGPAPKNKSDKKEEKDKNKNKKKKD